MNRIILFLKCKACKYALIMSILGLNLLVTAHANNAPVGGMTEFTINSYQNNPFEIDVLNTASDLDGDNLSLELPKLYGLYGQSNANSVRRSSVIKGSEIENRYSFLIYGGTSLAQREDRIDWNTQSAGEHFDELSNILEDDAPIVGSVWVQGEFDAVAAVSKEDYETELDSLISEYNTLTNSKNLVVVLLSLQSQFANRSPEQIIEWAAVKQAQIDSAAKFTNVFTLDPDEFGPEYRDQIHLSYEYGGVLAKKALNILHDNSNIPRQHGTTEVSENNTLLYTPKPGFTGTDRISYRVSDGNGGEHDVVLTITSTLDPAQLIDSNMTFTDSDVLDVKVRLRTNDMINTRVRAVYWERGVNSTIVLGEEQMIPASTDVQIIRFQDVVTDVNPESTYAFRVILDNPSMGNRQDSEVVEFSVADSYKQAVINSTVLDTDTTGVYDILNLDSEVQFNDAKVLRVRYQYWKVGVPGSSVYGEVETYDRANYLSGSLSYKASIDTGLLDPDTNYAVRAYMVNNVTRTVIKGERFDFSTYSEVAQFPSPYEEAAIDSTTLDIDTSGTSDILNLDSVVELNDAEALRVRYQYWKPGVSDSIAYTQVQTYNKSDYSSGSLSHQGTIDTSMLDPSTDYAIRLYVVNNATATIIKGQRFNFTTD